MDVYDKICVALAVVGITIVVFVIFSKNRKRKALNDATSSKSGHYWTPIEILQHGYFCVCCKKNLTTGYECDYCTIKVDDMTCVKQMNMKVLCKVKHARQNVDESMHHHWIPGNIEGDKYCCVCEEFCGGGVGLQDYRCSWCTRVAHTDCRKSIGSHCDFGDLRRFVIPPLNVATRKPGNRNQRSAVVDIMEAPDMPDWAPIIAIVNPKSGSGAGKEVLRKLRSHLHPVQVIDVTKSNMKSSLAWLEEHPEINVRILIAGGDGTISFVLDDIDKLERRPPVAILPLGTGNDLSRVLGWGKQCDGSINVLEILQGVHEASDQAMDRWTVQVDNNRKLGVRLFNKTLSMTNYVSIGVDACVTLGMQTTRNSMPRALSSRLLNKFLFFTYGTKDVFERACNGLNEKIDIYLDDSPHPIELPEIEGLAFLNIGCWGAGVKAWESAPENWPQSLDDGKFEIFAVTSSFHIAQLQVGLSTPLHLGQARKAVMKVKKGPLPMQSDGEAWMQSAATITITHKGVSSMLQKDEPDQAPNGCFF